MIFDVAVDLRGSSPTFGKWAGTTLSNLDGRQLWIPAGFAHGFYVLSEEAIVSYKVTDYYAAKWERTLHWSDAALNIDWPLLNGKPPFLSEKDASGASLAKAEVYGGWSDLNNRVDP